MPEKKQTVREYLNRQFGPDVRVEVVEECVGAPKIWIRQIAAENAVLTPEEAARLVNNLCDAIVYTKQLPVVMPEQAKT